MKNVLMAFLLLLCAGCATKPGATIPVNVAIPVKCTAEVPQRPVMPTEVLRLPPPTTEAEKLQQFFARTRAALAEIDFREGYEIELLAALKSCL